VLGENDPGDHLVGLCRRLDAIVVGTLARFSSGRLAVGGRSGDVYYSFGGVTRRLKRGPGEAVAIRADPSVHRLADAILYMNDGYGTGFARAAMLKAGSLDGMEIEMDKIQDFIRASSPDLLADTVDAIDRNASKLVEVLSQTVVP